MLSFPATLDSVGLELLVAKGIHFCQRTVARVPLNYKLQLLPKDFALLVSRDQQVKREASKPV